MAVNPVSGKVYVSNTEARNDVRFEGPGAFAGRTAVRGHLAESRITVLERRAASTPRHLNKHIDYAAAATRAATPRARKSLALAARHGRLERRRARSTSPRSARARSASSTPPSSRTTRFVPERARPDRR